MPLEITQREVNGVCVLALQGRLVLGDESSGFRKTVESILSSGTKKLVVNFELVNYVDSAGLGTLLEARRVTNAQGARLKVSNLRPNFKQALQFAHLLDIFDTFPTEAAAIESF